MKAIVTHVSQSTNSVIISINKQIPGTKLISKISGYVPCDIGAYQVGDEIELPENVIIKKETWSFTGDDQITKELVWLDITYN